MNCCDEYGNCRQGRDCPVRQQREPDKVDKTITAMLYAGAVIVVIVTLVLCVSIISWVQK